MEAQRDKRDTKELHQCHRFNHLSSQFFDKHPIPSHPCQKGRGPGRKCRGGCLHHPRTSPLFVMERTKKVCSYFGLAHHCGSTSCGISTTVHMKWMAIVCLGTKLLRQIKRQKHKYDETQNEAKIKKLEKKKINRCLFIDFCWNLTRVGTQKCLLFVALRLLLQPLPLSLCASNSLCPLSSFVPEFLSLSLCGCLHYCGTKPGLFHQSLFFSFYVFCFFCSGWRSWQSSSKKVWGMSRLCASRLWSVRKW